MTTETIKNPVPRHPEQRVGVFIDVQNLYYSAKNLHKAKANFGAVVKEVLADRKLIRSIGYVVRTESREEQPFFEALQSLGIETKERDLQIFYGGAKKADWDVGITVDAIRIAPTLDVVVLVSGDGDFIPLVQYLQNQGKQVEVAAFRETASTALVDVVDNFIDLSQDQGKFLIKDKPGHVASNKRRATSTRRAPARRAPARRTATRRAPARRTTTRRAPVRKPAVRRSTKK